MYDRSFTAAPAMFAAFAALMSLGCSGGGNPGNGGVARVDALEMVFVAGGTFTMGCTEEQVGCFGDERPAHTVTLDGYYIGKYEVTQKLWFDVMGTTIEDQRAAAGYASLHGVGDNYPMYYVSWDDVQEFMGRLSASSGRGYRLPTEAEWEYAARGGARGGGYAYPGGGVGGVAWYGGNAVGARPVGGKSANELGIYDMGGNVREWVGDWYGDYGAEPQDNPTGPAEGYYRVDRGGSWPGDAWFCRVSARNFDPPGYRYASRGFRLAYRD